MINNFKIRFLGDISFNGKYVDYADNNVNPFEKLKIDLTHYTVGNLECLLESSGENIYKKPRLKTKKNTFKFLNKLNIDTVSLANNHLYDNLEEGLSSTIIELDNHGISHFGANIDNIKYSNVHILEHNKIKVGIVTFVTENTNPKIPENAKIYYSSFEKEKHKIFIKDLKATVDFLVYYIHWGGDVENRYMPSHIQTILGKKLIDYGVDLIVGHHSHTLQPFEIYKGKYIFYSLGNFCFDDINFNNKIYKMKEYESIILDVDFKNNGYIINIIPITNSNKRFIYNKENLSLRHQLRQFLFDNFNKKILLIIYHSLFKYNMAIKNVIFSDKTLTEKLQYFSIKKIKHFINKL